ncbi:MAG: TetR/AcrR family transcriptional regulator [Desulfomonilaceae bacterium]|nr:TetR/AcrR family transcriptional regulator [Desulfomonilaceae bacterium]
MDPNNKRQRILEAAEEVFGAKGLQAASIAEIARKAEVTDSVIYQYFKSKEDLLFSVPMAGSLEAIRQAEEALQGIRDPASLLSRMVWFHLRYDEVHPDYSRVLLFECRSHPGFYKTSSYDVVRKYAGIMLRILEDGVKKGVFREQVDMRLVRDIIFGTLDFEYLGFSAARETEEASSDLENIMALVLPMISQRPALEVTLDKGTTILLAAEKVFAEKGFNGTKMSDVAMLAGVSEGTVYEYFESKEDLLLSIPARRFQTYIEQQAHAFVIKTPLRKLRRLIRNHFSLYLVNRDFLKVFLLQVQLSSRFYASPVYETYRRYFSLIEDIIEEGKSAGVFRQDVEPRVFRNMFFGTFSHMAIRWSILGKAAATDMMSEIDQATDLLSLAVLTDEALEESEIIGRGSSLLVKGGDRKGNLVGRRKRTKS